MNGAFFFLQLPGSGLHVGLPLIGYCPTFSQTDAGVEPDVHVALTADDVVAGVDRQRIVALLQLTSTRDVQFPKRANKLMVPSCRPFARVSTFLDAELDERGRLGDSLRSDMTPLAGSLAETDATDLACRLDAYSPSFYLYDCWSAMSP